MNKAKKRLLISFIIVLSIILVTIITYNVSFKPKVSVKSIDSKIEFNSKEFITKLLPKDIDFSFKGIKIKSSVKLSENELTELFISSIQSSNETIKELTGLKVIFKDNQLFLYLNFKKYNIPFQAVLNFKTISTSNNLILHYNYGKLGFIDIPKDYVFTVFKDMSLFNINNTTNDIVLSLYNDYNINITKANIEGNDLILNFEIPIKF